MKVQLTDKKVTVLKTDIIALPVLQDEKPDYQIEIIQQFLKDHPNFGKLYETQLLYTAQQKYLLIGSGKADQFTDEYAQNVAGTAIKNSLTKAKNIMYIVPAGKVEPSVIGAEIAGFDPSFSYKSEQEKLLLDTVYIRVEQLNKEDQELFKKGRILADAINLARNLGDMPANEMTPSYFLNTVKKIAKENNLILTVIDEKQAKKIGMGAFAGVAQGSDEPAYMIALEYKGNIKSQDKWGLVGKGITYDTGGLSLKPSHAMYGMKYDMSGSASVLATVVALAQLKANVNVLGVMAVTENALSGKPQMPGDIVRSYSGKTVEVVNTDAEGRLVLMDGLTWAQKLGATNLIDIATLTGAISVALGTIRTGVFGNNRQFTEQLIAAGEVVGERYWELPLDEEYIELVKSDFADMANAGHSPSGGSPAGAIFGAKFLEVVIENNRPWIHLDIGGTANDDKPRPYRGVGATGITIKTLVKLISLGQ